MKKKQEKTNFERIEYPAIKILSREEWERERKFKRTRYFVLEASDEEIKVGFYCPEEYIDGKNILPANDFETNLIDNYSGFSE